MNRLSVKKWWWVGGCVAVLVSGVAWWGMWREISGATGQSSVIILKKASLLISVTTDGSLEASQSNRLMVPTSRRGNIYVNMKLKWMIPEGSRVKPGDKVCELEAPELVQQLQQSQNQIDQAKAQLASYAEEIKLLESDGRSRLSAAGLAHQEAKEKLQIFFELDSKKKLRELEQRVDEARLAAGQAKDEFKQINVQVQGNPFMDEVEEKSVRGRLDAARITVKKNAKQYDTVLMELKTFKKYDFPRELSRLQKVLDDAKLNYQKAKISADVGVNGKRAQMIQSQGVIDTQTRQIEALGEFQNDLVMRSPTEGIVAVDRGGSARFGLQNIPLGQPVYSGMPLLLIPDLSAWVVKCDIEEAYRNQVKEGQSVKVEIVALPGEAFSGKIKSIGAVGRPRDLGDASSSKVYDVVVVLSHHHSQFMQGMSARLEIFVEEISNALSVPLEAVRRDKDGKAFVVQDLSSGPRRVAVTTGKSNEHLVTLIKGAVEGDRVFIVPPKEVP